ncbi:MarR family transcriptional regulator [Rhizobium sp. TRM95111]|uniref:MarR family winged helix-turn-helix transcriptional regulator n=1 Tax=Rhizobium alarense TaxID=2846851 RepID=UPI001F243344|nr:MarR family transcriptional regulator [Rhizobium alarense]MCF3640244.1 MarR family transcriptional regulator [Rhizobium alarense]
MEGDFDLETFLPYRLNRAAEAVSLRFAIQYKERYRMTRPEWRTLAALGANGRMSATAIGLHSSMHKTKVSRAVKALEDRRWLKRVEDDRDRRMEHIELTSEGMRAYADMAKLARAYQAELAALFGATGLVKLEAGLDAVESVMLPRRKTRRSRSE